MSKTKIPLNLKNTVFLRDNHQCRWCGRGAADGVKLHADHVLAEAFKGSTTLENLGTLCNECNLWKGSDYYGQYLLTTTFKVKDLNSHIKLFGPTQGPGPHGELYDGSLYRLDLEFYREIDNHFEKVSIHEPFRIPGLWEAAAQDMTSKIKVTDRKNRALFDLKNKIRDYLFENQGYLEDRTLEDGSQILIFKERK